MKRAAGFAIRTGTQIAKAGYEVIHLKSALTDAARDPIVATKQVVRKAQFLAEDFRDQLVLAVRKNPLKAVGVSVGAGVTMGLVVSWIRRRK